MTAHRRVTGPIVAATFAETAAHHGYPGLDAHATTEWSTRLGSPAAKAAATPSSTSCGACGVVQKNSRPNHPTTCGKVERFQQTMKKWLAAQPVQPATIADLQALLDAFVDAYNHRRPHRSLPQRATPATVYAARPEGHSQAPAATPTPTTGSAATGSTPPAWSPSATTAACTTSASAEPTPEPTS